MERQNSNNYSDPDQAPVVIEEVDEEEYRSNEGDLFEDLTANLESSPDFEGLRQRAISDDVTNPYVGEGIKSKDPSIDDEQSQEE